MAYLNKICILGSGGFGREVALAIQDINKAQNNKWNFIGFFDDGMEIDKVVYKNWKVLGTSEDLLSYNEDINVVIAVNKPIIRKQIAEKLQHNPFLIFPNIIHPSAVSYDESVEMGNGNIIFLFCAISFGVKLGNFNTINSYSGIGHDSVIGNFNSLNPRVAISGGVTIGDLNEFGMNSSIVQYKKVGSNNTIGANSLMLRSAKDGDLYFGIPAMKVKI